MKTICKVLAALMIVTFAWTMVSTAVIAAEDMGVMSEVIYYWGERKFMQLPRPEAKKSYTIGISVPHLKSPYWVNNAYGFISEAEKLGVKTILVAAKGYDDLSTQINQFENLMTQKVDAIIIGAISFEGNVASAEQAIERGIPVVNVAQTIKSRMPYAVVMAENYQLGVNNAEFVVKDSGGKANVVVFSGPSGASWSMANSQGVKETFAKYPGIKVLTEKFSDVDVAKSQSIMENVLQTFKDIDYVITLDAISQGVGNAIEEAGKNDRIKNVCAYLLEEGLEYVRRGSIYAGQLNKQVAQGRLAMDMAVRAANDEWDAPIIVFPLGTWLTKENVDTFDSDIEYAPAGWKVPMVTGN
jgi:TMAO reductase system protein TorT